MATNRRRRVSEEQETAETKVESTVEEIKEETTVEETEVDNDMMFNEYEEESMDNPADDGISSEETEIAESDIKKGESIEAEMFEENSNSGLMFDEIDPEALKETERLEKEEIMNKLSKTGSKSAKEELMERRIIEAGRKQRKEMYMSNDVIPLHDSGLSYVTEGEMMKREFLELVESQKAGKRLTGKVTGSTTIEGRPTAIVKYGKYFRVLIPFELFISPRKSDLDYIAKHPEQEDKQKRLLVNQRARSEVDFIIRKVDEVNQIAIGDRISAMQREVRNWYFGKQKNGKYNLNVGDKVEARIVDATTMGLTVEVRGKEFRLYQQDISHRYMNDVSKEYEVGTTIPVIFTKLERVRASKTQWILNASVSIKEASNDPRRRYFDLYEVGTNVTAVVTGVETYGIYCRIEDSDGMADVLCKFSTEEYKKLPKEGSIVYLRITAKDEANLHLYGSLIRTLKENK